MRRVRRVASFALVLALGLIANPVGATTLARQGLEGLVADNAMIVQGTVIDLHSYWNAGHNFIYTDVRIRPGLVFKGKPPAGDLTITLMGGTVGDRTILVVGGPELVPGSQYVLFINEEGLPGEVHRKTIRDLMQGVFEVSRGRAFSQAADHPLLPDARGFSEPPGGTEGMALDEFVRQVRDLTNSR